MGVRVSTMRQEPLTVNKKNKVNEHGRREGEELRGGQAGTHFRVRVQSNVLKKYYLILLKDERGPREGNMCKASKGKYRG